MSNPHGRPKITQEENIDLLIERVGTWYTQLLETKDNIEDVMSHPAAGIFLDQKEMTETANRSRRTLKKTITTFPASLADCATQEDVVAYLAASNNGIANIQDAVPIIRQLGLTTSNNDVSIRKNLGTVLVRTGRWIKIATWRYRSLNWKPPIRDELTDHQSDQEPSIRQEDQDLSTAKSEKQSTSAHAASKEYRKALT